MSNLKRLAFALRGYEQAHGALPPHAVYGPDGRPLLSWRVLLLPHVDPQQGLLEQFRLDEPWDSEHNLRLLPRMPAVYAPVHGRSGAGPHTTYYQVFVGPGAAFEGRQGLKLRADFPDGLADTFLVVEAGRAVPWTKPEDLAYDPGGPLPELGGLSRRWFQAATADTDVLRLGKGLSEATLRAAVTRNGGDLLGPDWPRRPSETGTGAGRR